MSHETLLIHNDRSNYQLDFYLSIYIFAILKVLTHNADHRQDHPEDRIGVAIFFFSSASLQL